MLGNKNEKTGTLLILKPVSKVNGESVRPFFEVSSKENDKWVPSKDSSINTISGSLFKIEAVEEEYKGDKYFRVKAFIKDGEETYLVPFRMNIATRSLLNSFFNLETFDNISIRYYLSKAGYDSYYVTQNDEKVTWKFESSDLPSPEEISFKGKIIRDFTKIDLFFVEQIKVLNDRIRSTIGQTYSEPKTATVSKREQYQEEEELEEIPF